MLILGLSALPFVVAIREMARVSIERFDILDRMPRMATLSDSLI